MKTNFEKALMSMSDRQINWLKGTVMVMAATAGLLIWPTTMSAQNLTAGAYHTLVIQSDGQTVGWGRNSSGQLGDGTNITRATPAVVSGNHRFLKIVSGGDHANPGHALGIESDGSLWGWGPNNDGQLVQASNPSLIPTKLNYLSNVVDMAAGALHSLVLQSDGKVWAFGSNPYGQLGNGSTTNSSVPIPVTGLSNIVAVAAGDYHSLALRSDGLVFCWGLGTSGQLGDGTGQSRTTPVAVTNLTGAIGIGGSVFYSSFAVLADGTVRVWGANTYGIFGNGSPEGTGSLLQVPALLGNVLKVSAGYHVLALRFDGSVWAAGYNADGELGRGTTSSHATSDAFAMPVTNLNSVTDVTAGTYHSVALKSDGSVWTWGDNYRYGYHQLAAGSGLAYSASPIQVTNVTAPAVSFHRPHLLFVKADGTVQAAGHNAAGQLGDSTVNNRLTPITILSLGHVRSASTGRGHSVAVRWDGTAWTWGWNQYGQLGLGSNLNTNVPVQVSSLTEVAGAAAGSMHIVAVRSNGTVFAWGLNDMGQLGDGTTTNRNAPAAITNLSEIKAVAAGERHSLAVTTGGVVYAWGRNSSGQLGDGTLTNRLTPVTVAGMSNAVAVAAGEGHSIILKSNGTVMAVGDNRSGQLGDGTTTLRTTAVSVASLTNITALAAGDAHTLALKSDGTVWAWGRNSSGQLGDGTTTLSTTPVQVAGLTNVIAIQAVAESSLAVLVSGEVKVFGNGLGGHLGTGASQTYVQPVPSRLKWFESFIDYVSKAAAAANTRFFAGPTNAGAFYRVYVSPLSYQRGVWLAATGEQEDAYGSTFPWFLRIKETTLQLFNQDEKDANNTYESCYRPRENVIAAFGTKAGGSPLYFSERYTFGIYAGTQRETLQPIRIRTFRLADLTNSPGVVAAFSTNYITVPEWVFYPETWLKFASNGLVTSMEIPGLKTTVALVQGHPSLSWDHVWTYGSPQRYRNSRFVLSHEASADAEGFGYVVDAVGFFYENSTWFPFAKQDTNTTTAAWVPLYAVNFDQRPLLRSQFIDGPHFTGEPVPASHSGKSLAELQQNLPPVTNTVSALTNAAFQAIDNSPELWAHPMLDKLVADLRNDPVALSAFVVNEIGLINPLRLGGTGVAIHYPGLDRGALAVLMERQGSPLEQCALLVYLLRKAGYSAGYVFPQSGSMQMPDTHLSSLLRMQLHGALNYRGVQFTSESLLPVNYPWVVVRVDGVDRHVFPWLKDTEVLEGLNLYDYMPGQYDTGFKWVNDYVRGATNILGLDPEDDTVKNLFPKHVDQYLRENHPGVSLDDIGVRFRDRKRTVRVLDDLPRPLVVNSLGSATVVDNLTSGAASMPALTNVFNTLQVQVRNSGSGTDLVNSGELRSADLHNRKLLIYTNGSNLCLWLAAYQPSTTNVLTGSSAFNQASNEMQHVQLLSSNLPSGTWMDVVLTHRRDRMTNESTIFLRNTTVGLTARTTNAVTSLDFSAVCAFPGRVTPEMLAVHAEGYWKMRQIEKTTPGYIPPVEEKIGTAAHLMSLKYIDRVSRGDSLLQDLHKVHLLYRHPLGLAIFRQHATNSVTPILDMPFLYDYCANASLRPDAGDATSRSLENFAALSIASGSCEEHAVIANYVGDASAVSTVRLLQRAQLLAAAGTPGVIELLPDNYTTHSSHFGADSGLWNTVAATFTRSDRDMYRILITPGRINNAAGDYSGMGVLIVSPFSQAALISGQANGGWGSKLLWGFGQLLELTYDLVLKPLGADAGKPKVAPSVKTQADLADNAAMTSEQAKTADLSAKQLGRGTGNNGSNKEVADKGGIFEQALNSIGSKLADPVDSVEGFFYLDTVDLALPGKMPVSIRRNYSSHNLLDGQFGTGWKINYFPYLIFITNQDSSVTVRTSEADGATISYPPVTNDLWLASADANVGSSHNNNEGGKNSNLAFTSKIQRFTTNTHPTYVQTYADGSFKVYQVMTNFPIVGTNSTFTRERPYLEKWQDNLGNILAFTYGTDVAKPDYGSIYRIQSSSGMYLGFNYDDSGRVIQAYTGDGRRLYYEYDKYGDLITVTLPDASQIRYEYQHYPFSYTTTNGGGVITTNTITDSRHLLVRETKPDGRVLVNEYDSERRVVKQWATAGQDLRLIQNATFVYSNNFYLTNGFSNSINGFTLVIDVFGNTNRYEYTAGLLTKITDPLTNSVIQEWYWTNDVPGSYTRALKSRTDNRGLTNTFLYDTNGNIVTNLVSGLDLTGDGQTEATLTFTYTNVNLLASQTDALGATVRYRYADTNYPTLKTSVERYAPGGTPIATNRYSYTNVATVFTNGTTVYTNKSFGVLTRMVLAADSPHESVVENTYDGRGFITQTVRYPGSGDPNVTNYFAYNDRGEMVEQRDVAGRIVRLAYDPRGNPEGAEKFDETGQRLFWEFSYYNENGELTWSDGPRFDPEDYVWRDYDGMGRKTQEIRWRSRAKADGTGVEAEEGYAQFATTFYEHDPMGNLLRVIDQYGNYDRMTYDANGQMLSKSRYSVSNSVPLVTEWLGYEAGGQVAAHTNALGAVTRKFYTTTGKLMRQENADGTTNRWTYDLSGRLKREYLPDGTTYWETTYDDANRRVTRTFSADASYTETKVMDRRGNLVLTTNLVGAVFTNYFDGLDRLKQSVGPATVGGVSTQQVTTVYYDAAGIWTTNANSLGDKTVTKTDALGRPIQSLVFQGTTVVRWSDTGYATNHHAVVVTNGTGAAAVAVTNFTDTFGKPVLTRLADGNFTLNTYDMVGNLLSSRDELGQVTQFAYDGLYRLAAKKLPDGAQVTYAYDALGNLTGRTMPGGLQWTGAYDALGRKTAEQLSGGTLTNRTFTYSYYTSGAARGLPLAVTDPRGLTNTTTYDVLRRATNVAAVGVQAEHNQNTAFTLDRLGRATRIAQMTTGLPSTQVDRTYDGYGQLAREQVTLGGTLVSDFSQTWTAAGRRTLLAQAGAGTNGTINYAHRADGLLDSVTQGGIVALFYYDDAGRLNARTNNWRNWNVTSRDARGRVTGINVAVDGSTVLAETLGWRENSTLNSYAVTRTGAWDENRDFLYDTRNHLTQETFQPAADVTATNDYAFDPGKLGVLVSLTSTGAVNAAWTAGGLDLLGRVGTENWTGPSNLLVRLAGRAAGAASNSVWLNGTLLTTNLVTNAYGGWLADMTLSPSNYTLSAEGLYPNNMAGTRRATNTFTVEDRVGGVTNLYDAAGNVTNRVVPGQAQSLMWDAAGRLVRVASTSGGSTNWLWTAAYDALGRRLQTVHSPTGAVATTITSYYDPQVEFGEVGVSVNGVRTWKVLGPDLNGGYGSLQGIGGLEGEVREDGSGLGAVGDWFGNVAASVVGTQVVWSATRVSGYGPVAGYAAPLLGGESYVSQVSLWRTRRMDPTGFYWLGARYYDPIAGRFISCDPFGHEASWDLYSYANGDPVNYLDPDGRLAKNVFKATSEMVRAPFTGINNIFSALGGDNPMDLINPFSRQFVGYQLLRGAATPGRIAGGIPFSILSGDIFDSQDPVTGAPTGISVNGIWNSSADAERVRRSVDSAYGKDSTVAVKNGTHFFGIGDLFQILGEELGLITTPSLHAADVIRDIGATHAVGHSQGSSVFRGAVALLSDAERSDIHYQGFGPQSVINHSLYGLASASNEVRPGDPVPYFSPMNLFRRMGDTALMPLPITQPNMINFGSHSWRPNYQYQVNHVP